jgi:hypothetical protein
MADNEDWLAGKNKPKKSKACATAGLSQPANRYRGVLSRLPAQGIQRLSQPTE